MTRTNNNHGKRPSVTNCNKEGNKAKRVRVEDPPPNTPTKHDNEQRKHRTSVENNLKAALRNESYATDEFLTNLSLEVTTCFTALTTKVYLVSSIIEFEPRPDFRKTMSSTSQSEKKGRGKKKKSDTTLSDLGPIPRQIDVMVNLFLSKVDNGVIGVLELLTRKQISERFKDYDMNNKWLSFESLLGNVDEEIGGASLYGRNVINYGTIKKYMLFYREILVWYMKNVQYPPGPDNTSDGLFFHTKFQNGSPHDSKQYVNAMKNFLDCLMANSSLCVSLSHSYNQVELDKHFKLQRIACLNSVPTHWLQLIGQNESVHYVCNKTMMNITEQRTAFHEALRELWVDFQRQSKRIFTTLSLCHLDIKLLTHKDFYQYFLPELFQNSFVLGTMVLLGEKWVPVGFHRQGDTNVLKSSQVILPLHSSLVFHNVIHYKDTVSNYYNIHFEFNDNRVTLSPCKLGTGNIRLAPFTDTKGILYLVNEWLIRKVVNPCKNLGENVVRSLEPACIQFISQVFCASMIEVDVNDSSFDCSIDNVCKLIMPKVLKANDNGCFGYDHVMETIEDLVLTERRFLAGAMLPKLSNENVAYFQRMDRFYIYPMAGVLSLDDKHNNETCVTRFLQYDVNSQQEVHQRIFMEHIPYVFSEIFVIDPEVVERYTWVEQLILYSYLPEMGTIFSTPLTEKLARYLLEKSDDLPIIGKPSRELNPVFNYLQGCEFVFRKVTDFETWNCFKMSNSDLKKWSELQNGYQSGFIPPWVVKDQSKTTNDHRQQGTNEERVDNPSKQSGIDRTKGDSNDAGTSDGGQDTQRPTTTKGRTNNECGSTDEGNTIENKKELPVLARPLIRGLVKVPKYPLRSRNAPYSYGFLRMSVNVVFKEDDPEIMYPIYEIKEQVCYAARGQFPAQIGECGEVLGSNYESTTSSSDDSSSDDYKSSDSKSTKNVSEDYDTPTSSSSEERKDKDSTSSYNLSSSEDDDEDEALYTTFSVSCFANVFPETIFIDKSPDMSSSGKSYKTKVWKPRYLLDSAEYCARRNKLNDGDKNDEQNPFLYHFETGFDALCAKNSNLVLTILNGCNKIDYVTEDIFPFYEEGDTGGIDHVWALGVIMTYVLCGYPALKGTEDIQCYNNVGIR
eukprot:jgi/Psemu1/30157/gm1.30157_g